MAEAIRMPKMSDTMLEGVIANWNVKVGDKVKVGDILAEVETDKATMDMETYYDGTILYIGIEKGKAVPIDALIAIIGKEGEDYSSLLAGNAAPTVVQVEAPIVVSAPIVETQPIPAIVSTEKVNANAIRMPKMSDTMIEGTIHTWLKKVGDKIKTGDILAEVETDKATMELESFEDGTLLYIGVGNGESIIVDGIIAIVGEEGSNWKVLLEDKKAAASNAPTAASIPVPIKNIESAPAIQTPAPIVQTVPAQTISSDGRIMASPMAKALAADKGIKLQDLQGSGEGGRIVKRDIDNYTPKAAAITNSVATINAGTESFVDLPLTQMRKAIARSLSESQSTAVDFQLTMEINMDKSMEARTLLNESSPVKISFNDMILKACAVALKKHPNVNASWKGDVIRRNNHVHVGMAVAIPEGLVVPVIRFADTLTLSNLAANTKELGTKAKNGKLQPSDWEGNTFTVSNLGMFGIDSFTSIINNPKNESCILSVGGIKETVGVKNGQFYVTNIMKITLTCDHRVVDGATGAAFMVTLKELLEEPIKLLI